MKILILGSILAPNLITYFLRALPLLVVTLFQAIILRNLKKN